MLEVEKRATIAVSEELLTKLARDPIGSRELLVPNNLKYAHCGGAASLAQFMVTWSRNTERGRLVTHAQTAQDQQTIENLIDTLPGLVGVLMASDVLTRHTSQTLRAQAYEFARKRIERMDEGDLQGSAVGPAVTLLCADHTTKRALTPLYNISPNGAGHVKGEADFIALADAMLDRTLGQARRGDLTEEDSEAIGVMLRELFSNTHEHARVDERGKPYRRSVRTIHFARHGLDDDSPDEIAGEFTPLGEYLKTMQDERRQAARKQFVELSIFDSGPGYAARLLGKAASEDLAMKHEYAAVMRCFMRNVSTRERPGGGVGLTRILQRLKAHRGFLRLRTGRLSLYKDFSDSSVRNLVEADYKLSMVVRGKGRDPRHAPVSGALLTLLLPIGR